MKSSSAMKLLIYTGHAELVKLLPRLVSKGLGNEATLSVIAAAMPLLLVLEATAEDVVVTFILVFPVAVDADAVLSVVGDPDRFLESISENCC